MRVHCQRGRGVVRVDDDGDDDWMHFHDAVDLQVGFFGRDDVNAIGMAISTIKVVLVLNVLGVTLNKVTPKTCRTVEPFCPIVGVIKTVILVVRSVSLNAGWHLERRGEVTNCRVHVALTRRRARIGG